MKVAILTSQERVEKFTDWSLVPKDTELIYIGQTYTDDEVIQKAKDADAILVDAVNVVSGNIIRNLPNLKLVQSEGVAYNLIDTEAAKEQGIYVCNNASANAGSVAEHTIMLMLACTRRLIEGDTLVRRGKQIQAKGSFILAGIPEAGTLSCRVNWVCSHCKANSKEIERVWLPRQLLQLSSSIGRNRTRISSFLFAFTGTLPFL